MGTYHQADNEVFIRSPNGSVVYRSAGSPCRPVSVAGLITDAGVVLPVEDNLRCRLIGDPTRATRSLRISPQLLADLGGSRSQLLERRPRSGYSYEGPRSGRSSRLAELQSVGVDDPVEVPRESIEVHAVKTPRSMLRQNKLQGVSSRGAWEGRLHPLGRGTSLYRGERRRRTLRRRRCLERDVETGSRHWLRHYEVGELTQVILIILH